MAVKLSIGLQKKIGLPNYGSLAASCYVEFEVDRTLIETDTVGFQEKVRGTFGVCQQAVTEQLARQQANESRSCNGHAHPNGRRHEQRSNGSANGQHAKRPATASQSRAIRAIAKRQQFDVSQLLTNRFGVQRPEDLSVSDASALIDELKTLTNGNGGSQ
jgi:hypothetical protein